MEDCEITSAGDLDFGSTGALVANVDAQASLQVQCTDTTPYQIGLDEGAGVGATVSTRRMSGGGSSIAYSLYQNAGRSLVWGNSIGVDTLSGVGNGSAQTYTIFGRVPAQATPVPAVYTDTISVTVTF